MSLICLSLMKIVEFALNGRFLTKNQAFCLHKSSVLFQILVKRQDFVFYSTIQQTALEC